MSVSRHVTDWKQNELLVGEGIKINTKMKIDKKLYIWKPKELHNR